MVDALDGVGRSLKPRDGVAKLAAAVHVQEGVVEHLRIAALLHQNARTLGSVASALKCWGAFADGVLQANGNHIPPSTTGLLAFSNIFSNQGTFLNYLSAIRLACQVRFPCSAHCSM